ncbi:MAG: hypothetical protein CVV61_07300 [Tenericutes bacterium HGW-Tenericutes-6]|nr:MAG: hypothetical protein CVV61_07300 [Tenericutes bacterium HGW-Tenericutes-6]
MTKHGKLKIKDVTLISICAAILFAQQLLFSMIPNVQLTTLLVVLFTKTLGFRRTSLIVIIHVLASSMLSPYGALNPLYLPSMMIGWLLIPTLLSTGFKHLEKPYGLAIFGFVFGFIYGWMFIPVSVFIFDSPFLPYLIADIPFEITMAITNFIAILWLYEPLSKIIHDVYLEKDVKKSAIST